MAETVRVRMAPAPTGRLHIGSARTTLFNWLFARHYGGKFVLRIEDTDQSRSTQENVAQILEAIRWLGLDWDEGPEVEGPYGPYFQSQRVELYRKMLARLVEAGKAYSCYCTPEELDRRRKEMQEQGLAPRYDRRCRDLSGEERERLEAEGRPKAMRFAMPLEGSIGWEDLIRGRIEFQNSELDDFVIVKSDGFPSYNFACAVDDSGMAMTHVLRGEDLISGTPRQLHVYYALGLTEPQFAHLPMILGPDRSKLSKRHGATSVTEYRDEGYVPEAIVNFIALLGWSPGDDREIMSREEMVAAFSLEGIGKSGGVFDIEKLKWMNGTYLREMAPERYVEAAKPFITRVYGGGLDDELLRRAVLLEQERAKTLGELPELTEFFFREPERYEEKGEKKWFGRENAGAVLAAVREGLSAVEAFDEASRTALREALSGIERSDRIVRDALQDASLPARTANESLRAAIRKLVAEVGRSDQALRDAAQQELLEVRRSYEALQAAWQAELGGIGRSSQALHEAAQQEAAGVRRSYEALQAAWQGEVKKAARSSQALEDALRICREQATRSTDAIREVAQQQRSGAGRSYRVLRAAQEATKLVACDGALREAIQQELSAVTRLRELLLEAAARGAAERLGVSAGQVIHTTRLAVTGQTKGPGLFELLAALGRERVLHRLERAEARVKEGAE